jgi:hypothetical protein
MENIFGTEAPDNNEMTEINRILTECDEMCKVISSSVLYELTHETQQHGDIPVSFNKGIRYLASDEETFMKVIIRISKICFTNGYIKGQNDLLSQPHIDNFNVQGNA